MPTGSARYRQADDGYAYIAIRTLLHRKATRAMWAVACASVVVNAVRHCPLNAKTVDDKITICFIDGVIPNVRDARVWRRPPPHVGP